MHLTFFAIVAAPSPQEVENFEKQRIKYIKVFNQRMSSYRDVVHRLTGWNVEISFRSNDMTCVQADVTLKCTYAESKDDYLSLSYNDGAFTLQETEFTKKLKPAYLEYLRKSDSYPGFLAQIVLDLCNQDTLHGGLF